MRLHHEEADEPREIEELARGLIRIPLRTPTLPPATRTNAFLIRAQDNRWWILDPSSAAGDALAKLHRAVSAHAGGWSAVEGAVFTHHHPDHVGGISAIGEGLPIRRVIVHQRFPTLLEPSLAARLRERATVTTVADRHPLAPGLALLHTPGHASDHLALWSPENRWLLVGDMMAGVGTILVNPPDGDMADYCDSLRRLRALAPRHAFPSHGRGTEAPLERIDAYLAHRLAREEHVLAALRDATHNGRHPGPSESSEETSPASGRERVGGAALTLDMVVARAWNDVPPPLRPLATRSALAHLEKLVGEERIERTSTGWRLKRQPARSQT